MPTLLEQETICDLYQKTDRVLFFEPNRHEQYFHKRLEWFIEGKHYQFAYTTPEEFLLYSKKYNLEKKELSGRLKKAFEYFETELTDGAKAKTKNKPVISVHFDGEKDSVRIKLCTLIIIDFTKPKSSEGFRLQHKTKDF